ncbi:hypothetical protein PsorP6_006969 [Peronosclerospora sorghi]|uniref:Uncharacterized protein n=1 Tax=Peronosclerospora sorghi TaxID=230839 RepID=A0ACC0WB40_9STRA|nr:hypothetical protein PsorP6_006969 [Peronosclerospora sorghi]
MGQPTLQTKNSASESCVKDKKEIPGEDHGKTQMDPILIPNVVEKVSNGSIGQQPDDAKRYVHRLKHGDNATDVEVEEDKDADINVDNPIGQQRGFIERCCDGLIFLSLVFRSILYRDTVVLYCQDAKNR